ncbi:protein kinase [Aureococcus anophagefferens]|nr:protein kinase [Aureococcus anophagefferens]
MFASPAWYKEAKKESCSGKKKIEAVEFSKLDSVSWTLSPSIDSDYAFDKAADAFYGPQGARQLADAAARLRRRLRPPGCGDSNDAATKSVDGCFSRVARYSLAEAASKHDAATATLEWQFEYPRSRTMRAWYSIIIMFLLGGLAPKASGQELAKLVASDAAEEDYFGRSVAVSGDLVTAKLLASDAAAGDRFGYSVAISGDLVVVGAFYDDDAGSNSGSAYVFRDDERRRLLDAAATSSPPGVGNADAGDWSGSAYVFRTTNDGASWTETAKLVACDAAAADSFGESVAISGDLVVAGGPVVGPICEVARDILRSVEEHSRKADDVLMAGRRVVDVLGALQQMSKNAAKLEFGNADLVESKMRTLKGLLCDFKLAVDAFGRAGWLKRAFHQRGHVNSLTKLDKEIATCLESLKLDYKLAVDADILQRTYQMEQSITMLVVENAHVPEDELLIEMRELSGESARDRIVSNFKKEVGIMDKLRKHPRTVDFVGICTTDASFVGIVTQYLPNGSLTRPRRRRGDAIAPKMQFIWAKDIAIGMAYLHKEGVLHRDLKSQNVLTNEWRCKITDFGISLGKLGRDSDMSEKIRDSR